MFENSEIRQWNVLKKKTFWHNLQRWVQFLLFMIIICSKISITATVAANQRNSQHHIWLTGLTACMHSSPELRDMSAFSGSKAEKRKLERQCTIDVSWGVVIWPVNVPQVISSIQAYSTVSAASGKPRLLNMACPRNSKPVIWARPVLIEDALRGR